MKSRIGIIALIIFSSAAVALAQTHIAGTAECSGPEQVHVMRLSDQAGHFFVMSQGKCHWTKPIDIAGTETQTDEATVTKEVRGNQARVRGYVTETTVSGDKFSYRIQGEQVIERGKTVSEQGQWTIVSGTGKLEGINGKGTYAGKLQGNDTVFELEGEYQAGH
ncbi:MAG TPA: hypothetical protein VNM47_06575 [Terriglobia bacterium]|nr:hypothetical protein [Terriglobia bacterium]